MAESARSILVRPRPDADDVFTMGRIHLHTAPLHTVRALDLNIPRGRLTLVDLGLGYLTLGEATPALSGGEAQRLKLASELDRDQHDALFVLDEPSVGLHPLDVRVLLGVLQGLVGNGATVVFIEHDLDMIANADFVVDLGPGGGVNGGRITATGTPEQIADSPDSVTGRYLRESLEPTARTVGS